MTSPPSHPKQEPLQLSSAEFVESYNIILPIGFPRLSEDLLRKFKSQNMALFKEGEMWSIDKHRKEVIDWFQIL